MSAPAADEPYYDPVIQTMPLEQVQHLQADRLARQLDRIWSAPVPFFQRKLEAAGLQRNDLCGLDELSDSHHGESGAAQE